MTATLPPQAEDGPGATPALPGYPGFVPPDPGRRTPWALIVGLTLVSLVVLGAVGGAVLLIATASGASAAGGCGGG